MKTLKDKYRLSNGVEIPCIGLGTYLSTEEEGRAAVIAAVNAGYRLIDTASRYENEDVVGKAVMDCGVAREELFVTSKVWNDCRGYDNVLSSFERTMKNLGLEYVDLLLVHWPAHRLEYGDRAEELNADTWRAFEDIYASGRVKAIGVSNFKEHHLQDLFKTARIKPMVNQIEIHPGFPRLELVEYCQKNDIVVEAWSPLGGNGGDCLKDKTILEIAERHKKSAAQICGRWNIERGVIPLLKSVKPHRIAQNIDIFDFSLTEEEVKEISAVSGEYGHCFDSDSINF